MRTCNGAVAQDAYHPRAAYHTLCRWATHPICPTSKPRGHPDPRQRPKMGSMAMRTFNNAAAPTLIVDSEWLALCADGSYAYYQPRRGFVGRFLRWATMPKSRHGTKPQELK